MVSKLREPAAGKGLSGLPLALVPEMVRNSPFQSTLAAVPSSSRQTLSPSLMFPVASSLEGVHAEHQIGISFQADNLSRENEVHIVSWTEKETETHPSRNRLSATSATPPENTCLHAPNETYQRACVPFFTKTPSWPTLLHKSQRVYFELDDTS